MTKYKYIIHFSDSDYDSFEEYGDDEGLFNSYEEAQEAASYAISCYRTGGEILNLRNPGDYDENEYVDFDIEEVEI